MASDRRPPADDENLFQEWWTTLRLAWRLLLDRRVGVAVKLVPFLALLYLLFPLDFLPDFIPGLGQLDDVAILLLGLRLFLRLAPPDRVAHHRDEIAGPGVVEGEWRRSDSEERR